MEPKLTTRHAIIESIDRAIQEDKLTPGSASKLRGIMGWLATNSLGRVGRVGIHAVKQRQYARDNKTCMTEQLRTALLFMKGMAKAIPSRINEVGASSRNTLIAYSDAEYTEGNPPRLGWVILDSRGSVHAAATLLLDARITALWKPRKQQIFPAESLAPSAALANHPQVFAHCDVRWFVDNESACSTLIRGASREEDVNGIAECTHLLAMRLNTRLWFEWVDSKANPSDGLSRQGLECPLFGSLAVHALQPAWQLEAKYVARLRAVASTDLCNLLQEPLTLG